MHEVGRNADFFNPEGGKLMKAGSNLSFQSVHPHANGADTRARLDVGFKFHPRGYEPTVKTEHMFFGNGVDLDIEAMDADQTMEAYFTLPEHARISIFEPHMHAPDPRNWSGGGHRSVDQMFINLMRGVYLTEEEFQTELEERRQTLRIADGDTVIGCPQCGAAAKPADGDAGDQQ